MGEGNALSRGPGRVVPRCTGYIFRSWFNCLGLGLCAGTAPLQPGCTADYFSAHLQVFNLVEALVDAGVRIGILYPR